MKTKQKHRKYLNVPHFNPPRMSGETLTRLQQYWLDTGQVEAQ